jgi:hypothetical protein
MKSKAKSLRFSEAEEAEIRLYVEFTGEQEAVVMERVAMRGLREERLERAMMAYLGGTSSSEAAAIAGIGRHTFLSKALERGVAVLDDQPEDLLQDLSQAASLLKDERLAAVVARVGEQLASGPH